jgi:MoaA/NifB/PqqE/SkfB family radical SAM enzyme
MNISTTSAIETTEETFGQATIVPLIHTKKADIINGWKKSLLIAIMQLQIIFIAIIKLRSLKKIVKGIKGMKILALSYIGNGGIQKIAKKGNHFFWDMYGAKWPSATFVKSVSDELYRQLAEPQQVSSLRNVLLAITTKCPLQCEHCYEWDNLNIKEKLSKEDLHLIVRKFQENGAGQIHFGGGEPLMRYDDIIDVLNSSAKTTDFWLVSSGYKLTAERAEGLKNAGLTGVSISLDHYLPEEHNRFRHFDASYDWVEKAIKNSNDAGLVTALSLCATKEFVSEQNISLYAELAKKWGVAFIQIIEPRATGHYAGKDVALSKMQHNILERSMSKLNNDKDYKDYPIAVYHESYLRKSGCFGAGKRFVYVDPLGNLQACPFCRSEGKNITHSPLKESIIELRKYGCQTY